METQPRSAMAVASLVLGIVALVTSILPIINNLSFLLAILGIVFAISHGYTLQKTEEELYRFGEATIS